MSDQRNTTIPAAEWGPEEWLEGLENEEPISEPAGEAFRDAGDEEFNARVQARVEELAHRQEVVTSLAGLRRHVGRTQVEVAASWRRSQPQVSRVESDPEHVELATLAGYIEALGGHMTIEAEINGDVYRVDIV